MSCVANEANEEHSRLWAQLLESVWLHLLGKGHLSENGGIGQNIKHLWCVSEAPRLKVAHRLPCSLNKNVWIKVEMKHKFREAIKTWGKRLIIQYYVAR